MSDTLIILHSISEVKNAANLALKITTWLQENQIIERNKSQCLLGLDDWGYKPSKNYPQIVEDDPESQVLNLGTCGFTFSLKKEVFDRNSFTTATKVICPKCNSNRFEGNKIADFYQELASSESLEMYDEFQNGFENWENGIETLIPCPSCKKSSPTEAYIYEPKIYFSNLSFVFWNWAELKSEFISKFKDEIGCEIAQIVDTI